MCSTLAARSAVVGGKMPSDLILVWRPKPPLCLKHNYWLNIVCKVSGQVQI